MTAVTVLARGGRSSLVRRESTDQREPRPVTHRRRTHASVLGVVAALAALALLWPSWLVSAQSSDPEVEREGIRRRQADLAAELDVLRASDAEIAEALAALNENLSA